MTHAAFSRKGGKARSNAKTRANRAKAAAYWKKVRKGLLPAPKRSRVPPRPEALAKLLRGFCRRNGIKRLEAFGSVARGDARRGSDVDLLVSFSRNPGLRFFTMSDDIAEIVGVPVHLLTRQSAEQISNPYRRESILAEATVIYDA
jgi:predicted nucleotidyltransferase